LSAPAGSVFEIPEKARAWIQPFPVQMHRYAEDELPPGVKVASTAEPRGRHGRGRLAARHSRRMAHASHASGKGAAKQKATRAAAGAAKRTHVASLKKRKI
jgi:hypothetical protein